MPDDTDTTAVDALSTRRFADPRQRRRVAVALGWVGARLGENRVFSWWSVSGLVSHRWLVVVGVAACVLPIIGVFGLSTMVLLAADPDRAGAAVAVFVALFLLRGVLTPPAWREGAPRTVIVPRRPRSRRELTWVALAVVTGILMPLCMSRLWRRVLPDDLDAESCYRAARRGTVVAALIAAWAGVPVALSSPWLGTAMLAPAMVISALAVLFTVLSGCYARPALAELALSVQHRRLLRLRRTFAQASAGGVLTPRGNGYLFSDDAVRERLSMRYLSESTARERAVEAAVLAKRTGARAAVLRVLGRQDVLTRAATAAGIGVGLGVAALAAVHNDDKSSPAAWFGIVVLAVLAGFLALFPVFFGSAAITWCVRRSVWVSTWLPWWARAAAALLGAAGVVCLVVFVGVGGIRHAVAVAAVTVFPTAAVAGVGGWACVLLGRRCRTARTRWLRYAADAAAAAVIAMTMVVAVDRDLLSGQWAAGLLLPVAAAESVVVWRVMSRSSRLTVRVGADIAASLLLGGAGVLTFVWLASLLHLPPAEVAAIRETTEHVGALVDLPHWIWAVVYVVLAAAGVAFTLRPNGIAELAERLRIAGAVNLTRRIATGVHIALLAVLLVGAVAPPAVAPILRERIAARYTETLAAERAEHGEVEFYRQLRARFAAPTPPAVPALAALVVRVDAVSPPTDRRGDATETARHLAHRLGALQLTTLDLHDVGDDRQRLVEAARDASADAGFDDPLRDAADLDARAGAVDREQHADAELRHRIGETAELAALAVSQALQIPQLSRNEVVQLVAEYLSGLVENGSLREVFAAWIGRMVRRPPPDVADAVVPEPTKLAEAADAALDRQLAKTPVEPIDSDDALARLRTETGIDAAVDIANQTRYLQEDSGPCHGCAEPARPKEHGPGGRPYERPIIEPR